jgi:hypothetical protein
MTYLNKRQCRWILFQLCAMDFWRLSSMTNITLHCITVHYYLLIMRYRKYNRLKNSKFNNRAYTYNAIAVMLLFAVRQRTMKFKNLCTGQTTKPAMSVLITYVYGSRGHWSPGSPVLPDLYIICYDFRTWHWPKRSPAPTQPYVHSLCVRIYQVYQYFALARYFKQ